MTVDSIKNGVVIDHITPGNGMKIYHFLGLDKLNCPVAIIMNAASRSMPSKDIIKVDTEAPLHLDALGYLDAGVTVNIIKNGERVEKYHPEMPIEIRNIVKCHNPRCITSTEQELPHIFRLTDREAHVYRCIYCESKGKK